MNDLRILSTISNEEAEREREDQLIIGHIIDIASNTREGRRERERERERE